MVHIVYPKKHIERNITKNVTGGLWSEYYFTVKIVISDKRDFVIY